MKNRREERSMDRQEVFIDISARHVHLTREDQDKLFGEGYELEHLKPIGVDAFASVEQIVVEGPRSSFNKVRILGPCRSRSQIELSKTDARTIGVDAPVRLSGDLEGTPGVKLTGPAGEIELTEGVIIAKRHLHLGYGLAEKWGYKNGDVVAVRVDTPDRTLIFGDTEVRVFKGSADMATVHIDTDEANAAGMPGPMNGYIVEI